MLIDVKDITKIYKMGEVEVHALRGINLGIKEGEYIAITGPSGSGKSTLMHILGCLDTPTSGTYLFRAKKVHDLSEDELANIRNREVGFVFQTFNLLPRLKAYENVELPLLYAGGRAAKIRDRALKVLHRVGLGDRVNHRPTELSGGERQRVAVARALVNNPRVILADEPTGNLDTKTGGEIMELFGSLHREGRTLIVVTHDPEVSDYADHIVRIRDGILTN
ncbi:macrolide ABC transporter ATP-binding protein [candidate division WOR-3 bacterium JGI_Cruoil_03_44_89]|uniref:Macrolide ABC transporter ATP-binding protein n=1 Tax=candidate division WOR-3 bacterium JGI_Cruoil_03_44_89 TaxID=1973748 RepID=A0A235BSM1_UNCW3|nr:MAG: macrolide ABC transporter ATP-binding protein [candidate division WOR-3 bacterium JGI_Cruoil_03_44_89]